MTRLPRPIFSPTRGTDMNALFSVAPSLEALQPVGGSIAEAIGDVGRYITALSAARRRLSHEVERTNYIAPSDMDAMRDNERRLTEELVFLKQARRIHDPFGLGEPVGLDILQSLAPASVRQAAE